MRCGVELPRYFSQHASLWKATTSSWVFFSVSTSDIELGRSCDPSNPGTTVWSIHGRGHRADTGAAMDQLSSIQRSLRSDGTRRTSLARRLIASFSALADEMTVMMDRRSILEHKLRYAHEQVDDSPAVPARGHRVAMRQTLVMIPSLALDLELLGAASSDADRFSTI